jgi:hypothetical protein
MMAIDNCEGFEVLAFNRSGDGHGIVRGPTGPGLGVGIDWELINSAVERIVT